MKIPVIHGLIDRRILINVTTDPGVLERHLPAPFRQKFYNDKVIVGVCLIRLKNVRPKGLPDFVGVSSENGNANGIVGEASLKKSSQESHDPIANAVV